MIKIPLLIFIILTFTLSCSAVSTYYSHYNNYLQFHWASAIKSTSILFKIFPYLDKIGTLNTFIVIYTKPANVPVTVIPSSPVTFVSEAFPVQEVTVSGLTPDTQYYYTFIFTQDATIDSATFISFYSANTIEEFEFRTFKVPLTAYNFTFGAASCAETGSTSPVFQNMYNENFDFFIHMGDLHYQDISSNNINKFYDAYYRVFNSAPQKKFFQNTPIYYVWDDHDFGPNDAEGTSASKPAATAAFKRFAPYNPLKNTLPDDETGVSPNMAAYLSYTADPDYGIFRSWIIGRCLFIMMDLRTYKDVIPGDLMGENQRTWIENQIRYAGLNPDIKLVFFISSVPWISTDEGAIWGDFGTTQEWIGTLVTQHIYGNNKAAMLLAGDAHMVAFDDGRNNKWGGFPVVQAASMDRYPSCKGGPYSHGMNPDRGQYARIEVTDSLTGKPCVNIQLKKLGQMRIAYNTCYPQFYPASRENECPSKFQIWLKSYPGAVYILGFGSLGVFIIICFTIFMCRRRRLRRKAAALKKKREAEYAQAQQEEGQEMKDMKEKEERDISLQKKEEEYAPPAPLPEQQDNHNLE